MASHQQPQTVQIVQSSGGQAITTASGATVLSNAQTQQLLQKLRSINAGNQGPQSIKIQAVQTNPTTGVRQIVAIPIQSSQISGAGGVQSIQTGVGPGGSKVNVSPMKVIRLPAGGTTTGQVLAQDGVPHGVKVVKLPASSIATATGNIVQGQVVQNSRPNAVNIKPATTQSYSQVLSITPSKDASTPLSTPGSEVVSRKRSDIDFDAFSDAKRRKTEKGGKGLRHFSMKVCEKVQAKGTTSYNEVADELVNELTDPGCASPTDQQYDQKNIRRRVYDALNVLMAMNIISKEKKEIRWLGLPTNSVQEANGLEVDKTKRIERIKGKTQQLQDLILQQIAFKNLVERNKEREKVVGAPAPNSAIQLPFIVVNTNKKTNIEVNISNDKMEYLFNFDDTFEIHDDMEVLKRMGLGFGLERGNVKPEDLEKARKMVPRALEQYVTQLAENGPGSCAGIPKVSSPQVLREASVEPERNNTSNRAIGAPQSDHDTDSEVDIN